MNKLEVLKQLKDLPKREIHFSNFTDENITTYKRVYELFNKRHRTIIFKNKTQGVALIDLQKHEDFDAFVSSINGKNSAAYYRRKAIKNGYTFKEINKNDYLDEIFEINTSAKERQGQEMSEKYRIKQEEYLIEPAFKYFGIFDKDNKLVAYSDIGFFGEFSLIAVLLGHKQHLNNGVMYFMLIEIAQLMYTNYQQEGYNYIMYDTFFGASEGLKKFKTKLGFEPYKVKWKWG